MILRQQSLPHLMRVAVGGFVVSLLITIMILLNPFIVGVIDSLMLQMPCSISATLDPTANTSYIVSFLWYWVTVWSRRSTAAYKGDPVEACRQYHELRCHLR